MTEQKTAEQKRDPLAEFEERIDERGWAFHPFPFDRPGSLSAQIRAIEWSEDWNDLYSERPIDQQRWKELIGVAWDILVGCSLTIDDDCDLEADDIYEQVSFTEMREAIAFLIYAK